MASLIENLIHILHEENKEYEAILAIAQNKTDVIVRGDVSALQAITEEEQLATGRILKLDKKREEVINDIGIVINEDSKTLTISKLITLLDKQPEEKERLMAVTHMIRENLDLIKQVNDQNGHLIQQSLEFIDYTMNVFQSSQQGPETANYGNHGNGPKASMFDAKQ